MYATDCRARRPAIKECKPRQVPNMEVVETCGVAGDLGRSYHPHHNLFISYIFSEFEIGALNSGISSLGNPKYFLTGFPVLCATG